MQYLFLVILLFSPFSGWAQPTNPFCIEGQNIGTIKKDNTPEIFIDLVQQAELKCPDLLNQYGDSLVLIYQWTAELLYAIEQFEQSGVYYDKAIAFIGNQANPDLVQKVHLFNRLASVKIRLGIYNEAKELVISGLKLLHEDPTQEVLEGQLQYKLGSTLYRLEAYKEAEMAFKRAEVLLLKHESETRPELIRLYQAFAALLKKDSKFREAISFDSLSVQMTLSEYGKMDPHTADAYNRFAISLENFGKLDEAEAYYLRALDIFSKDSLQLLDLANTYENLAYVSYKREDYGRAIPYFNNVIDLRTRRLGPKHPRTLDGQSMLGLAYFQNEDFNKADEIYTEVLNHLEEKVAPHHSSLQNLKLKIALVKDANGNSSEGLEYLKEVEAISVKANGPENHFLTYVYTNMASVYRNLGNLALASTTQSKAIRLYEKHLEAHNPRISAAYNSLASIYMDQKKYNIALENLDKALDNLQYSLEADPATCPFPMELLDALNLRSSALLNIYVSSPKEAYLRDCVKNGNQGLELLFHVRSIISDEDSGLKVRNSVRALIENQLEALYILQDTYKDKEAPIAVFRIMEFSKNFDLFLEMNKYLATQSFKNVPEIQTLDSLNQVIESHKLDRLKGKIEDSEFSNRFVQINAEITKVQNDISVKYPKYHQLKYTPDIKSLSEVQSKLTAGMAVLEYYRGVELVYTLVIRADRAQIFRIEANSTLEKDINYQREAISGYFQTYDKSKLLYDLYNAGLNQTSHKLYRWIFEPLLPALQSANELIIIPDGSMNFIPFEILLSKPASHHNQFKSHAYLLKSFQISYDYAMGFSVEKRSIKEAKKQKHKVLGFAPEFSKNVVLDSVSDRHSFAPLKYNKDELASIKSSTLLRSMEGDQATKSNFLNYATDYNVLHLATHGISDTEQGELSHIAFNPSTDFDASILNLAELYMLDIPADLVVLSACETGIGELKKGEGVFSLTRGFLYSGTKSVISSLWSVNDASTAKFMDHFYAGLSSNHSRNRALSSAKRLAIEEAKLDYDAHPYFWAGFVLTGETGPVELSSQVNYLLIAGIALFLMLGTILFFRRQP